MAKIKDPQRRAAMVAVKEDRARDAARALQERDVERTSALAKTARLKALRLAAADAAPAPAAKVRKPK